MKSARLLILSLLMACVAVGTQAVEVPRSLDLTRRVEVQADHSVQGGVGHISFTAVGSETTFRVYSITGQLVRVVKVPADQTMTIDVPKGFYIVKCGDRWSRKVVVK